MKKIILAIAILMILSIVLVSCENKETNEKVVSDITEKIKSDSTYVSDEIKIALKRVCSYDVKTITKVWAGIMILEFDHYDSADEIVNGIDGRVYLVERFDGTIELYQYVDGIFKYIGRDDPFDFYIYPTTYKEYSENNALRKMSPDIEIYAKYLFVGWVNGGGSAIYYQTNKGEYIYFGGFRTGECLFPVEEFKEFSKATYDRRHPSPPTNGGITLDGIWDLSQYQIDSESFDPNGININYVRKWVKIGIVSITVIICVIGMSIYLVKRKKKKALNRN